MPNLWTMRSTQDHTGKDDDDYKARRFKKNAEHHATTEDKCVLCFKKYKITITEKIKTPNSATRIKYTCTPIYGVGIYIYILFQLLLMFSLKIISNSRRKNQNSTSLLF